MDKQMILEKMETYLFTESKKKLKSATEKEKYHALAKVIMGEITPDWIESEERFTNSKKAYYLSSEYLMGRALTNNLINMQRKKEIEEILEEEGIDLEALEEQEEDAALGNGGLGRLAACFLDSAATLDYPLMGYGIRYQYGIFKQEFKNGFQVEKGDDWTRDGDPWSIKRRDRAVIVKFYDEEVVAVPFDMPIIGYGKNTINTLRLWEAHGKKAFDLETFNRQDYQGALEEEIKASAISKVLYPDDSTEEGKILRLKQQYFFVSASLQDLIHKYKETNTNFHDFHKFHAIQLNDTHPAVAVPELMRLLTTQEELSWEEAWEVTTKTLAYTNHTLMAEALEQWPVDFYKQLLPEIYEIIHRINNQLIVELREKGITHTADYEIIHNHSIKMAWLSIYGTHSTNGVAELHTNLLKNVELKHWYEVYPERFNNKTNGITQRRWLLKSNPELSELITELLGSKEWVVDLEKLKGLTKYQNDEEVLERFEKIKRDKKRELADFIQAHEDITIDPGSIFDVQIKRLHEYKRQLLLAFYILDLYYRMKDHPKEEVYPRTFIFGAKAAPGYFRAKGIIKFINEVKELINEDPDMRGKLKVVFVENYRVSYAEKLFPAADLSEQISTAGKEASGTGNMKFMLNGAPTIGTYDGANIEIVEEAGDENNFIFGLRVEDIEKLQKNYDPKIPYNTVPGLKRVVDTLIDGTFDDENTGMFKDLHDSLLIGAHWHHPDHYYILKDFEAYRDMQKKVDQAYRDRTGWLKKAWANVANAGEFSSDRTIEQYAKEIWDLKKEQE